MHADLRTAIATFVRDTPLPQIEQLAHRLATIDGPATQQAVSQVQQTFAHPALQKKVAQLLHIWQHTAAEVRSASLALVAAGQVQEAERARE